MTKAHLRAGDDEPSGLTGSGRGRVPPYQATRLRQVYRRGDHRGVQAVHQIDIPDGPRPLSDVCQMRTAVLDPRP